MKYICMQLCTFRYLSNISPGCNRRKIQYAKCQLLTVPLSSAWPATWPCAYFERMDLIALPFFSRCTFEIWAPVSATAAPSERRNGAWGADASSWCTDASTRPPTAQLHGRRAHLNFIVDIFFFNCPLFFYENVEKWDENCRKVSIDRHKLLLCGCLFWPV